MVHPFQASEGELLKRSAGRGAGLQREVGKSAWGGGFRLATVSCRGGRLVIRVGVDLARARQASLIGTIAVSYGPSSFCFLELPPTDAHAFLDGF